jgi:predicted lipid-binding transport protein (Tim44 family)
MYRPTSTPRLCPQRQGQFHPPASCQRCRQPDDIREFTSPEMFAEIKMSIAERKGAKQETDVADLNAQVIDVAEEGNRYVVSVHFNGHISEDRSPVESFDGDLAHDQADDGSSGWVIAGIQQVQ